MLLFYVLFVFIIGDAGYICIYSIYLTETTTINNIITFE